MEPSGSEIGTLGFRYNLGPVWKRHRYPSYLTVTMKYQSPSSSVSPKLTTLRNLKNHVVSNLNGSPWRLYWYTCLLVFALAGIGKLAWLIRNPDAFSVPDPVVPGISIAVVTSVGLLLELVVVCFVFLARSDLFRAAAMLWWTFIISSYRFWFPSAVDGKYCPCFGDIPQLLGLADGIGGVVARTALQCMAVGAAAILLVAVFRRKKSMNTWEVGGRGVHLVLLFLIVAGSGIARSVNAQGAIRIEGQIQRSKYMFHDGKTHSESGGFVLLIDPIGERMELSVSIHENPLSKEPRVLEYIYRTDGEGAVSHGVFDTNIVYPDDYIYPVKIDGQWLRATNDLPRAPDHVGQVFINPHPFPSEMLTHAIPFCLAYNWRVLSEFYTGAEGPEMVDRTLMSTGELPIRPVKFDVGSNYRLKGLSSFLSYAEGATTNEYFQVSDVIKTDFGLFPSELSYLKYTQLQDEDGLDLGPVVLYEIRAVVTDVTQVTNMVPALLATSDFVSVYDCRFALDRKDWIPVLNYRSTNGSLPTLDRVKEQPFYTTAVRLHANSQRQARFRIKYFLMLCATFPIGFAIWWGMKKK